MCCDTTTALHHPLLAVPANAIAQVLMNFVMVCSMSVTSPLILPFGLLYFVGLWAVWRCAQGRGASCLGANKKKRLQRNG